VCLQRDIRRQYSAKDQDDGTLDAVERHDRKPPSPRREPAGDKPAGRSTLFSLRSPASWGLKRSIGHINRKFIARLSTYGVPSRMGPRREEAPAPGGIARRACAAAAAG